MRDYMLPFELPNGIRLQSSFVSQSVHRLLTTNQFKHVLCLYCRLHELAHVNVRRISIIDGLKLVKQ
jgi:hypothetical protein